jgi:hypothetical protein
MATRPPAKTALFFEQCVIDVSRPDMVCRRAQALAEIAHSSPVDIRVADDPRLSHRVEAGDSR